MYRILIVSDEVQDWHDLGEGPWEQSRSALHFAETEVGAPWIVVDDTKRPVAYGDSSTVVWSRLRSPHSSCREAVTKFYFVEVQYNIVREPDRFDWADSGEGPFDSAEDAVAFAKSECGLPWRVVDEDFHENCIEYDAGNEDQSPGDPPACPACKARNCEPGGGNWWCNDCGMEF
jgi:hypothetical protein